MYRGISVSSLMPTAYYPEMSNVDIIRDDPVGKFYKGASIHMTGL